MQWLNLTLRGLGWRVGLRSDRLSGHELRGGDGKSRLSSGCDSLHRRGRSRGGGPINEAGTGQRREDSETGSTGGYSEESLSSHKRGRMGEKNSVRKSVEAKVSYDSNATPLRNNQHQGQFTYESLKDISTVNLRVLLGGLGGGLSGGCLVDLILDLLTARRSTRESTTSG